MVAPMMRAVDFDAMGCAAHLAVSAENASLVRALTTKGIEMVETLEAHWSRFRSDSDVTRINSESGTWVSVAPSTFAAVQLAVLANELTGGRFDALVGATLRDNGYAESFGRSGQRGQRAHDGHGSHRRLSVAGIGSRRMARTEGLRGGIEMNDTTLSVMIPPGAHLDLGGIGKGYAGDLVSAALLAAGATGVMVNLGGDVRVAGTSPDGVWHVEVDLPQPVGKQSVLLTDGALAVSATSMRTWDNGGVKWHHLITAATRTPAVFGGTAAVIAGSGWWAEAVTKIALCSGSEPNADLVIESGHGAHAIVIPERGGVVTRTPSWNEFVVGSTSRSADVPQAVN